MRQVLSSGLWIGHAGDLRQPASLLDAGVEAIIDLAANDPIPVLWRDIRQAEQGGP
ncbi:MAG: hypothetical protein ACKV0T_07530 [Planctomycetales bacterium]